MKQYKLIVHQPNFSEEDLIINPKDFPTVHIGDIVEIFHPEDEFSRLLLQVTSLKEDFQQKDTISVKQAIANSFQLRTYADVHINVVNKKEVALDSIELTFKDQYLGRSDMWRLKKHLENTCAYLNKKLEFCGIRCEVYEMWAQGERVACGAITEDTKIVFRSSTSMVYLFIQMSSEMWDTDINGDLYFEKAVNGFLADLFAKWKKNGSSHEVTVVLFSRTFYEAQLIEEFPEYMRECLQQDYKGRFYEDFYRVAVQNERFDDWTITLVELKRVFNNYPKSVLEYHNRPGVHIPKAVNSTAAQGNFLEVLNMSLNVFEKHYLDRSFERTGQLSVVITPGVGVFEVDRELTNITKQRIIDNGVGSDLVCLGEQPLHAVPLFKFHNKNILNAVDDYSMPHWINLSFYSTSKQMAYSCFVPRIKLPVKKPKLLKDKNKGNGLITRSKQNQCEDNAFPSLFDFDAYDAQVFKLPHAHINGPQQTQSLQRNPQRKRSDQMQHQQQQRQMPPYRKFSEADITLFHTEPSPRVLTHTPAISIPNRTTDQAVQSSSIGVLTTDVNLLPTAVLEDWEEELGPRSRAIVGSAGSPYSPQSRSQLVRPGRALINPFDPSHVTIKLTSNRRRWTHVFPLGPTGIFMQQHHYQAIPHRANNSEVDQMDDGSSSSPSQDSGQPIAHVVVEARRRRSALNHRVSEGEPGDVRYCNPTTNVEIPSRNRSTASRTAIHTPDIRSLTLLWGATGEQEWTPALTTGVDWKSLTIPACLPLTTDYFPDRRSLQNDYVVSDYTLLPDDVNGEIAQQRITTLKPLSTAEVFEELVSQRLQQGFQQIVMPKPLPGSNITQMGTSPQFSPLVRSRTCTESEPKEEYLLSIGRIFHKVSLVGSTITVTCFRPRHPYPTLNIHYHYRFQAPDMNNYEVSWVNFTSEKLESYNWNYLDHYICWRGQGDFTLTELLKYWRFRLFLLPGQHPATKKIIDGSQHCDLYSSFSVEEEVQLIDGFIKFLEVINRIRKPHNINRKTRKSSTFTKPLLTRSNQPILPLASTPNINPGGNTSPIANSIYQGTTGNFRERGGSNRLPERPKLLAGSKIIERVRSESGNGGRLSPANDISETRIISSSSLSLDTGTETLSGNARESTDDHSSNIEGPNKFNLASSSSEMVKAMKTQPDGLSFISRQQGLPLMMFISSEAVTWIMDHVDGANDRQIAINIMEKMLADRVICHASGSRNHPFIYGFYLYYFVPTEKEFRDNDNYAPCEDLEMFQNEWVEVAVKPSTVLHSPNQTMCLPVLLEHACGTEESESDSFREASCRRRKSVYKNANLDIVSEKVDRAEWGHLRYHSVFIPGLAFELVLQWMVATCSIITELVQNWTRKAVPSGFHLVPIPSDPFALPFSYNSDPLRGPIFIPLELDNMLESGRSHLFEEFTEDEREERMIKFQEAIAHRFGFLPCLLERGPSDNQHHYVHITGNMFIMIPTRVSHNHGKHFPNSFSTQMSQVTVSSPHEEYITRHVMGKGSRNVMEGDTSQEIRIGFLWSWNYMLTKRWRTSCAGDELFTSKMLKDFREFCSNSDDRLKNFWINEWQNI